MGYLKPFMINQTDIQFILDQLNFVPLFDANGNIIIAWDGTGTVYDFYGKVIGSGGSAAGDTASQAALEAYGSSYQNYTDLAGTRDVSGYWNNLTPTLKHYGDTGFIFPRMAAAIYSNYLVQTTAMSPAARPVASDLAAVIGAVSIATTAVDGVRTANVATIAYPGGSYSFTYDTWTRLTTTEKLTTKFIDGGHIFASLTQTNTLTTTQSDFVIKDSSGEHVAVAGTPSSPVATTGAVVISGGELDGQYHHFTTQYALGHQSYAVTTDATASTNEVDTFASDGTAINIKNVVDYTPRMISRTTTTAGVIYDTWANHQNDGAAAQHTPNEIYYGPTGEATVLDWGQLETVADGGLGQIDTQARLEASAGQGDHFIGSLNPGVSPSNGFFVLFGQFFDHGLDFIEKGQTDTSGRGVTIKIALAVDDPLYGMLGPDGRPVTEITISRASVQTLDANGTEYANHVSPFIDQSQTYGSDAQRTQLLREWVPDFTTSDATDFRAGMTLLDGTTLASAWAMPDGTMTNQTLPTLNELRANIAATGRADLSWEDIGNLRARDAHGQVIDTNSAAAGGSVSTGEALLLDMNPRFDATHLFSGDAAQDQQVTDAIAYLNTFGVRPGDATHPKDTFGLVNGVLTLTLGADLSMGPGQPVIPAGTALSGASALAGWVDFSTFGIMQAPPGIPAMFVAGVQAAVSHILVASVGDHYIAGDGRVNENFGLTSIHHIFHEEHNFQVGNLIDALHRQDVATNDVTHEKLHEFQIDTGHGMNAAGDYVDVSGQITWDQDKVFQGAKLIVEMEYQHAAVDQYARNVSPNIQEFVGYSPDKMPDVSLEYSQVAFRFGHSTLRETIDTIDPAHGITGKIMGYALHDAFLAPEMYAAVGPSAILLGMTHQQQNEVDEFVTPALNQGLLGQPLDLAAINIARGRDIGMPTLNDFREAIGLARYTSWNDFGQNMQHPSSLANFIAAYAFDGDMAKANAIVDLASGNYADSSAGLALGNVLGWVGSEIGGFVSRAIAFLSGDDAAGGAGTLGFNQIDTWLGGLAEIHQPGGLLGETFDLVFVTQIEALMDGDRFYYLYRLAGQQFGEEVANAQLKDIVERNSGLAHLNGNVFGYADQYVDLGAQKEVVAQGAEALTAGNEHKYGDIAAIASGAMGVYSNGGLGNGNDGMTVTIDGKTYVQDTRLADTDANSAYGLNGFVNLDGTPNSGAESNEVIVGTKGDDLIYAQGGDDTVYGEDGNDVILGGYGIDRLYGGAGSDMIKGGDNPDLIDGGSGDDFLYGESSGSDINGADQIIGGAGNDYVDGGVGIDKLSAGSGDDRVYGGQDTDPFTHGGDGNDYVDGGSGGDILYGDNGSDVVVGGADQDQLFGNDGDDILRPGDPTGALTIGGDEVLGGDGSDVNDKSFDLIDFSDNNLRPGGVTFDLPNQQNPATTPNGSSIQVQSYQIDGVIGSAGNDTITGDDDAAAGAGSDASIAGDNWLIGGSGADIITGGGGNDIVIGGSIRLDTLIGKYNTAYDHNNANAGNTEAEQLQDALYQGASHRVLSSETIDSTGIIDAINATIPGSTNDFAKHFTEMLRTELFKDMVLGDGGTDANTLATPDIAVFSGRAADYRITAIPFNAGNANGDLIVFKVEDLRVPGTLDANGVEIPTDGTDIVVGVELLRFVDRDISLLTTPPSLDLHGVITSSGILGDNFDTPAFNNSTSSAAWPTSWSETGDFLTGNVITGGQIQLDNNTNQLRFFDSGDGASIQRTIDLSGASAATLSFTYDRNTFDTGDAVNAQVSFDNGTTWHTVASIAGTGTGASLNRDEANGSVSANLGDLLGAGETFGATAIIRFNALTNANTQGSSANNGYLAIDNLAIAVTKTTLVNDGTNNFTGTYVEGAASTPIAAGPLIVDDGTTIASATATMAIVAAGDRLRVANSNNATGNLSGGIHYAISTAAGVITVALSGTATLAQYQAAIAQISFSSTSDNPTAVARVVSVTVNDGVFDSPVATATISVTPVNDAPIAGNDFVVTNGTSVVVPAWTLLANDTDVDGPLPLYVSAVSTTINSGLGATLSANASSVSIADTGSAGGSFGYTVTDGGASNATTAGSVTFTRTTSSTVLEGANTAQTLGRSEIIIGGNGNETITGHGGDDIILAGGGDDTIVWNANSGTNNTPTDGHDLVDGGTGTVDSVVINGRSNVAETFRIYSNTDDWDNNAANGIQSSAAHAGLTGLNANTEIVITRTVGNVTSIIAELDNVEEITVNTLNTTANNGNNANAPDGGASVGDTVQVVGNFTGTSLNYSTIHINGGDGDDTVDISQLTSDHRIVFHGGAGSNQVVGDVRPQDVVDNSVTTTPSAPLGNGGTDTSGSTDEGQGTPPVVHTGEHEGEHGHHGHHLHGNDGHTGGSSEGVDQAALAFDTMPIMGTASGELLLGSVAPDTMMGLGGDDQIFGAGGDDVIEGGAGRDHLDGGLSNDVIFGGADDDTIFGGDGNDLISAEDGNDWVFGGAGSDLLHGNAGNDTIVGGAGGDLFVAQLNDGDDTYFGDDFTGGIGNDTLDMGAITANITADLGTGVGGLGSVSSSLSGNDALFSIENIVTGSGNDVIRANTSVNVMDGGAGNDTFRFGSAAAADGDTIVGFEPGDRIDLSEIDANAGTAGDQSFTLVSGSGATHLLIEHETRADGEYTVVSGVTANGADAAFHLDIAGNHNLTQNDFNL